MKKNELHKRLSSNSFRPRLASCDRLRALWRIFLMVTSLLIAGSHRYSSEQTPEQSRFVKTILADDLDSPMELDVAPDGRVFFTELLGGLYVFDPRVQMHTLVHKFAITKLGSTGLIGLTLDPNFAINGHLYLYYTPGGQDETNLAFHLARYTVRPDNTLDLSSEKLLLIVPVHKNSGSHHGGSLAWDKNGNLYLSTGDTTNPNFSMGFSPIDERSGEEYISLDAQRTASNTNVLTGKILRIHPEQDGTYSIPDGNLFPRGMPGTLPEIYVMGCRNPYRIAVNPKTSAVYWGEIGPDAGKNDSIRGPRGYDEFNQAKGPGNFGWPYFVGNNFAYARWDFQTNTAGSKFNPEIPINNSPNNTGIDTLPPAQPAMIWYPYSISPEFPELGQGGRSAMAGAFYTYDENLQSPYKFPKHYDGMLFIFDWMRNWVRAVRFDHSENYLGSEELMPGFGDFRKPIDLTFGSDGVMYMLEYGSVYGANNDDARLVKVEYHRGNRPPIAKADFYEVGEGREISGMTPLTVAFSSRGSYDPDKGDTIKISWTIDGRKLEFADPRFTFTSPGTYQAVLQVIDSQGLEGYDTLTINAGNTKPKVSLNSKGNQSFFWEDTPFLYSVLVEDKEDPSIEPGRIKVKYVYSPKLSQSKSKKKLIEFEPLGKRLIEGSDCKACHTLDKVSVGPSFEAISRRYNGQEKIFEKLALKIINGGGGNWDTEHIMNAHPQIAVHDVQEMVKYILSLTDTTKVQSELTGNSGSFLLNTHRSEDENGGYIFLATYTDGGGENTAPLKGTDSLILRSAKVRTIYADDYRGFFRVGDSLYQGGADSYLMLKDIDLTGIRQLTYEYSSEKVSGEIIAVIDKPEGRIISTTPYRPTGSWSSFERKSGKIIDPVGGRHDIYFIATKPSGPIGKALRLESIFFSK